MIFQFREKSRTRKPYGKYREFTLALTITAAGLRKIPKLRGWGAGLFALPIHISYFSILYLILKTGSSPGLIRDLILVLTIILYLAYGVLVNDFFDREIDIAAGKVSANRGHQNSKEELSLILVVLVFAILGLVYLANGGVAYDVTWVVALFLASAYSAPPLKLKERGFWGFVTDSVIEKPLPILIVFTFFHYYGFEIFLFPVFGELLDSIFKHQVEDYDLDSKLGIKSFAIMLGKKRSALAVSLVANPLNVVAAVSLIAISFHELPKARVLIFVSVLLIALGMAATEILRRRGKVRTGFPFPEPPVLGLLNFGLRSVFLGALALTVLYYFVGLFPLVLVVLLSVSIYLMIYYRFFRDFIRGVRPR